jgi:putative transcriptional regulator
MKNRLREMREEVGLSQRELAESVGVTRQTINSVERGRYDPSLELAFELAEFFGCHAEDIFLYDGDEDGV